MTTDADTLSTFRRFRSRPAGRCNAHSEVVHRRPDGSTDSASGRRPRTLRATRDLSSHVSSPARSTWPTSTSRCRRPPHDAATVGPVHRGPARRAAGHRALRGTRLGPRQRVPRDARTDGTLGRDNKSEVFLVRRLARGASSGSTRSASRGDRAGDHRDHQAAHRMHYARPTSEIHELLRDRSRSPSAAGRHDAAREARPSSTGSTRRTTTSSWSPSSGCTRDLYKRRADLVGFVNGIPLVFIELKASHRNLEARLRRQPHATTATPSRSSSCPTASSSSPTARETKVGTHHRRLGALLRVEEDQRRGRGGSVSLETVIRGMCDPGAPARHRRELHRSSRSCPGGLVKLVAQNHQYLGVNNAIARLTSCDSAPPRQRRQARRLLAHPGLRQDALDGLLHAEGAAQAAGQLDLRHRHRPRRPGRPDRTRTSPTPASSPRSTCARPSRRAPPSSCCARTTATSSR